MQEERRTKRERELQVVKQERETRRLRESVV